MKLDNRPWKLLIEGPWELFKTGMGCVSSPNFPIESEGLHTEKQTRSRASSDRQAVISFVSKTRRCAEHVRRVLFSQSPLMSFMTLDWDRGVPRAVTWHPLGPSEPTGIPEEPVASERGGDGEGGTGTFVNARR